MTSALDITSDLLQDNIPVIRLLPAPIPPGGQAKWSSSGRTLLAALSPSSNSFAAWVAPKVDVTAKAWEDENGILQEEPVTRNTDVYEPDKAIYMGAWGSSDESLHAFYKDTFTIFNSAQAIHQVHVAPLMSGNLPQTNGSSSSPTYEQELEVKRVGYMRELAENYMEAVEEVVRDTQLDASIRAHHLSILCILSLATLLFFPQDGLGDSLAGEELLDWLNSYGDGDGWGSICDSANRLASRVKEWEEDDWENTVCLSILRGPEVAQRLLQSLSDSHPEPQIASFANILSSSLAKVPRSRDVDKHPTSASFLSAHASWRERLRAEISIFCHGREDQGGWLELENDIDGIDRAVLEEESERWEQVLMRFASLMWGDQEAILETVEAEGGGDWTLALGIWGVWVDVSLRRDRYTDEGWIEGGMRPALGAITEALPVEPTNLQETTMLALCNNEITDALVQCNKMSLWLATHLTDLLEKLNLVDDDDDETYELPLRDYFVFQYTDMLLLGHEGYWEVACDYLSGCGAQGVGRIREILKRISLNIGNSPNFTQTDDNEDAVMEVTSIIVPPGGTAESNDDLETVNALLKVASDHGLEDERREICRLAALQLLRQQRYGQAVVYCIHSMDTRLLAAIGEAVLDVYCSKGTEAYLQAVETIPSSIFTTDDGGHHVLLFLARFKEFLEALAEDRKPDAAKIVLACFGEGLVPEGFSAVLLLDTTELLEDPELLFDENDTCELLRNLEIVSQGATLSPSTYLRSLSNLQYRKGVVGKGNTDMSSQTALEALDAVRLAAARNRVDMYL